MITCEHGGNDVPSRYAHFFQGQEDLLQSHRGQDPGALTMARELAASLSAPLLASSVTRLLVDLNRSLGHPRLHSDSVRKAPLEIRQEILTRYYLPYRTKAETQIRQAIANGGRVIHVSSHSFTPELNGQVRNADIGLLYDPGRSGEARLSREWQRAIRAEVPGLKVRMNYPYAGTADGMTVSLRKLFPGDRYIGLELEINQKHVHAPVSHWNTLRDSVIKALQQALAEFKW